MDQGLIDRANARARERNLQDRARFVCVEPGRLPFEDSTFDVVFSKDEKKIYYTVSSTISYLHDFLDIFVRYSRTGSLNEVDIETV